MYVCDTHVLKILSLLNLLFSLGVKLSSGGDSLGQQYTSPTEAILNKGADVIIVGRGILATDDPVSAAFQYKESGYSAYEQSLKL